jgi:hypothetical protein
VSSDIKTDGKPAPKVFISYRWSSPDHEDWVLRLATLLRSSGIDAKLDKWSLKEGQDTLAFMESMVSDHDIEKVLMICDAGYVERADSRQGGVGTEAQIISAKVYNDTNQEKFAAVVVELDSFGKPLLPVYMTTRLYFDMSTNDAETSNYEKIVRWIFNEPFHALPPIGPKPDFLRDTYNTGSPLFRLGLAKSSGSSGISAGGEAAEVLRQIAEESASFIQTLVNEPKAADLVYDGIKATRPVSENLYRAIRQIVLENTPKSADTIHVFFESLMKLWDFHPLNTNYSNWDNDVYQYFVHDAFVSFVGLAMQERSFNLAAEVLAMPFYKPNSQDVTGEEASYAQFRPYLESLEQKNQLLSKRRISLHADLINEAHEHSIVDKTIFFEADLTLYLRSIISNKFNWYPVSALYLTYTYGSLPTYVRASSKQFYDRLKPILINRNPDDLRKDLADQSSTGKFLRFDYRDLQINRLINAENLATAA